MPDLISVYDSEGKCIGKCGSSCYMAKEEECKCICGGNNHGIGFRQAMAQTAEITESLIKKADDGAAVTNEAKDLKLVQCQGTELDEDLQEHFFKKVTILPDKEHGPKNAKVPKQSNSICEAGRADQSRETAK
jgi:hypothetical protein